MEDRIIKFNIWASGDKKMLRTNDEIREFAKDNGEDYWQVKSWNFSDLIPLQFTGLLDKNGIEIYEGHVGKFGREICEVIFENGRFCLKGKTRNYAMWVHINDIKADIGFEVIGDKYQNPELIK